MAKYAVNFINRATGELFEAWEMHRRVVTKQDFRNMLNSLHEQACHGGCDSEHLMASVLRDGKVIFFVLANTHVDGSRIWADMYVERVGAVAEQPVYVDTMWIAD